MLDIIGIGSLNIDFIADAGVVKALPPDKVSRALQGLECGVEHPFGPGSLNKIIMELGIESFRTAYGGSAFNTIHAIATLDPAIHTGFVGIAGRSNDSPLDFIKLMQEISIDHSYVGNGHEESGGLCVCINHGGRRSLLLCPGCNSLMADHLRKNYNGILKYISQARVLHVTSFMDDSTPSILAGILEDAKNINPLLKISFDPGYNWVKNISPAVCRILQITDVLFLNQTEFNLLANSQADMADYQKANQIFSDYDLPETILVLKKKLDTKLFRRSNYTITEQSYPSLVINENEIIDATGAGDLFAAGFLIQFLKGAPMGDAVYLGMRFAGAKMTNRTAELYRELTRIYSIYSAKLSNS